ncbi:MAG: hypothetical protein JO051_09265 [Acidobacteriaceae bacterium]|nr:hypothetical protein [Acidobacteriaceae bacterium]
MTHLKPSHEQLVKEALSSGRYRSVDEFLDEALSAWKDKDLQGGDQLQSAHRNPGKKKTLSELFASLRGLDIDLSRNPSTGRPIDL